MAFLGGLLATVMVYQLGASANGLSMATMLLAGIAITALAGAFTHLCTYFADDIALRRQQFTGVLGWHALLARRPHRSEL